MSRQNPTLAGSRITLDRGTDLQFHRIARRRAQRLTPHHPTRPGRQAGRKAVPQMMLVVDRLSATGNLLEGGPLAWRDPKPCPLPLDGLLHHLGVLAGPALGVITGWPRIGTGHGHLGPFTC